jgi:hypothetical protein
MNGSIWATLWCSALIRAWVDSGMVNPKNGFPPDPEMGAAHQDILE